MPRFTIAATFTLLFTALASSPARADETAPVADAPTVTLHASDSGTRLERRTQTQTHDGLPFKDASLFGVATWEPACAAPCGTRLDPRFAYRVAGEGLVPSDAFALPTSRASREGLAVDAKMGSSYQRMAGVGLSAAGGLGLLLGGAALVATPILESDHVGSSTFRSGVLTGGIVVAGAGAIALVSGLWLWLSSDTTYRIEPAGPPAGSASARPHVTPTGLVF
jgi:hypothetical protein